MRFNLDDLHMAFGGLTGLAGVRHAIRRGEIFPRVGPNGVGKTVPLLHKSGLYARQSGRAGIREERLRVAG